MFYLILADLVMILHLAFVIFVLCGGLLVLKWRWIAWLHLPAAVWGAVVEFTGLLSFRLHRRASAAVALP
jgi:hypothetical protein